jgi:hypothetical protein
MFIQYELAPGSRDLETSKEEDSPFPKEVHSAVRGIDLYSLIL